MVSRSRIIEYSLNSITGLFILLAVGANLAGFKVARTAFLLGGLVPVVGSIYHANKADELDPFLRIKRQSQIEAYAEHEAQAIINPPALPPASTEIKYFDWNLIQTKPDKYAHLAIVGGTGDGKSTLVQSLMQLINEPTIAIDPHWAPDHYPGIPTVAKGRNYGEYPADPISF
jgi:hypothetical protein